MKGLWWRRIRSSSPVGRERLLVRATYLLSPSPPDTLLPERSTRWRSAPAVLWARHSGRHPVDAALDQPLQLGLVPGLPRVGVHGPIPGRAGGASPVLRVLVVTNEFPALANRPRKAVGDSLPDGETHVPQESGCFCDPYPTHRRNPQKSWWVEDGNPSRGGGITEFLVRSADRAQELVAVIAGRTNGCLPHNNAEHRAGSASRIIRAKGR
jgi:hypothetical protein